MVKGAVHPNGTNFRRAARLDVVARVRRLCETKLLRERPPWLEWCERVPPPENHSLNLQSRTVRNPYPAMVRHLLKKYPDLRFQDCYVDGNDWSAGNDAYRDDHPVMQFVARQLDFMRTDGLDRKDAFKKTEELFRERRRYLEREQKISMAMNMALGKDVSPMFTTGRAYLQAERAKAEEVHLNIILRRLRKLKEEQQWRPEDQPDVTSFARKFEAQRRESVGPVEAAGTVESDGTDRDGEGASGAEEAGAAAESSTGTTEAVGAGEPAGTDRGGEGAPGAKEAGAAAETSPARDLRKEVDEVAARDRAAQRAAADRGVFSAGSRSKKVKAMLDEPSMAGGVLGDESMTEEQ